MISIIRCGEKKSKYSLNVIKCNSKYNRTVDKTITMLERLTSGVQKLNQEQRDLGNQKEEIHGTISGEIETELKSRMKVIKINCLNKG